MVCIIKLFTCFHPFISSVRISEKGNDDETFEDGGNVKGVESGKKSGDVNDGDERVEGEECNLLEQYFSKKQNPAKKKFHVNNMQTYTVL